MAPDAELIERLRRYFADCAGADLVFLFGSQARGDARPGSDVDVAVSGALDRLQVASDLRELTGRDVDVVDLAAAGHVLLQQLLREGILVHEGRRHAHAQWRTQP